MIEGDIRDDRDHRFNDVGCIEAAPHAYFENCYIDRALGKCEKGQGSHGFKEAGVSEQSAFVHQFAGAIIDAEIGSSKIVVRNWEAVYLNALIHARQMRRGIKTDA